MPSKSMIKIPKNFSNYLLKHLEGYKNFIWTQLKFWVKFSEKFADVSTRYQGNFLKKEKE